MQKIFDGDLFIKLLVFCSFFGMNKDNSDLDEDIMEQEDDVSISSILRLFIFVFIFKIKKRKVDDMKEYFEERDKKFF